MGSAFRSIASHMLETKATTILGELGVGSRIMDGSLGAVLIREARLVQSIPRGHHEDGRPVEVLHSGQEIPVGVPIEN